MSGTEDDYEGAPDHLADRVERLERRLVAVRREVEHLLERHGRAAARFDGVAMHTPLPAWIVTLPAGALTFVP